MRTTKTQEESQYGRLVTTYRNEFDAWEAVAALDGEGKRESTSRVDSEFYNAWTGCTLKQARDYVRFGWEAGVAMVDGRAPVLGEGEVPAWEYGLGEEGSEVDVATWLSGEPACMGDMRTIPSSRPLVRIAVDMSTHHQVEAAKMLRVGRSVLICVERLRAAGFPTQVDVIDSCYGVMPRKTRGKAQMNPYIKSNTIVRIQRAGEPMHGALLAFWVAHPAALRRATFALEEMLPWATRVDCGFRASWSFGFPINGQYSEPPLRSEYDEWAPAASRDEAEIDAWVADVMDRRLQ